jgi:hypothetical protein
LPKTAGDIRGEMATVIKHSDIKESGIIDLENAWGIRPHLRSLLR